MPVADCNVAGCTEPVAVGVVSRGEYAGHVCAAHAAMMGGVGRVEGFGRGPLRVLLPADWTAVKEPGVSYVLHPPQEA